MHLANAARRHLLAFVASLAACSSGGSGGLGVTPPDATLPRHGQQQFAATAPSVSWSVREGASGGSIGADGMYTAPGSAGTYTVVADDTASGASGEARVTVVAADARLTHGLTIPPTHPRLWLDAERLATARAWWDAGNAFTPTGYPESLQNLERALWVLLNDTATAAERTSMASLAVAWAVATSAAIAADQGGNADTQRWNGEATILVFDWLHAYFTPAQRATFIANTNTWVTYWIAQAYGGAPMCLNNYYWGHLRDHLLWGIASHGENALADAALDDALVTRYASNFVPVSRAGGRGAGAMYEGPQYGPYILGYSVVPFRSAEMLGRPIRTETDWWLEAVYTLIYDTTMLPTPHAGANAAFRVFPTVDMQSESYYRVESDEADFMIDAAMRWSSVPAGRHARQWVNMVGAAALANRHVRAVDPGGSAAPFTSLPLDYYAPGPRYLLGRASWTPAATHYFWLMGDRSLEDDPPVNWAGHSSCDWGSFQLWRNGRWLTRHAVGYGATTSHNIDAYGDDTRRLDADGVSVLEAVASNVVLVNGAGSSNYAGAGGLRGLVPVTRLESRPGYSFAAVSLTPAIRASGTAAGWVSWVRDYVFVRELETTVILDRVQSSTDGATKTFLLHSEWDPDVGVAGRATITTDNAQQLVATTLVPAAGQVTSRKLHEGGTQNGQWRIEIETTPGTAQSYILTVLQAKDAAAAALSPRAVDEGTHWTVTLDADHAIVFQKGMTSSGGSFTVRGVTTALRADVQPTTLGPDGPVWQ